MNLSPAQIRGGFWSLVVLLFAQSGTAVNFENYSIDDGLPSSEVYQVLQDNDGYLWFATDRGVCRYDGNNFKVFTKLDGLTDDVVFGFHLDHLNRLWFYSFNGGLCYYRDGRITEPAFNIELKKVLKHHIYPVITTIFVDNEKGIWIGTNSEHLFHVNTETHEVKDTGLAEGEGHELLLNIQPERPTGLVYNSGHKYSEPKQLVYIDITTGDTSRFPIDHLKQPMYLPTWSVRKGKHSFFYASGQVLSQLNSNGFVQSTKTDANILNCLVVDSDSNLWVGTRDGILLYRNGDLSANPERYLPGSHVSSFCRDGEGGYWFTTLNHGIMYTASLSVKSKPSSELGSARLFNVFGTKAGVYTSASNGNVYFFPGGNMDSLQSFPTQNRSQNHFRYSKDMNLVYGLGELKVMEHDGTSSVPFKIWYGFDHNDEKSHFIWNQMVLEESIEMYDFHNDTSYFFPVKNEIVVATLLPRSNEVWFGNLKGLYTIKNGKTHFVGERIPELAIRIADIDVIDEEHLLVSTRGNGAWIVNCNTYGSHRIKNIPNSHCHSSIVDQAGNLWLATFSGVFKVSDPLGKANVRRYGKYEGLMSNEVTDIMEYQGRIWVSTGVGISNFGVDWIPSNPENSPVRVASIQINNQDTTVCEFYQLNHDQNNISITANVISYMMPVQYEYKMSGLHEDWIRTYDRRISFSELKPANYTLLLRAGNRSQKSAAQEIRFSIAAPFWATSWFRIMLFTIPGLLIILVANIRFRIIRRENKLYNLFLRSEQKALRSQINPHFLFNSLNSLLEILMTKKHENVVRYVLNFSKLMRKVLENSREESIVLQEEIEFLGLYLSVESQRFDNGFKYSMDVDPKIETSRMTIPPLLIQPYLENALKHGVSSRKDDKARIDIRFYLESDQLKVDISDNGTGYKAVKNRTGRKHQSLGMRINGERFKLFSNSETYSIDIDHLYNDKETTYKGTLVRLTFPIKTNVKHEFKFS